MLSSLAESKPGKEYEDRAYNSSLLLKKLACEHPMLLLRYILAILEREHLSVYLFQTQCFHKIRCFERMTRVFVQTDHGAERSRTFGIGDYFQI